MEIALKKEIITSKVLSRFILVATFVILTALGAFVRIPLPFTPVPITLQTFFVLLCAALLGRGLGLTAQLSYIFLGVIGLPIFSGAGSGLFYLSGPTGGYIFGFLLAVIFVSYFLRKKPDNFIYSFAILSLADFILLACGVVWLKVILGYSLVKLLAIGFLPFVAGDLIKAFIATLIYLKLKTRLKEIL
jgi:biotin transport system substrate-specific component